MSEKKQERRGLGRGLSALMADVDIGAPTADTTKSVTAGGSFLAIEKLIPNPDQPRKDFSEDDLNDLAASIGERGIIQPLIVREDPNDRTMYQIVAGERRWRAAQLAQLHEVPVVVREFTDTEVLEVAIIENIQRADLNAIEEALGYRQLQDKFGHTQEQMATALGKSRSHIANLMRLLSLPAEVVIWVREGKLSAGHARALITADDPVALARRVISGGLSVRDAEKLAKKTEGAAPKPARQASQTSEKDADTRALEGDLSATIGMKVVIEHNEGKESGRLVVSYGDFAQLDELCRLLAGTK